MLSLSGAVVGRYSGIMSKHRGLQIQLSREAE
jgi:hypothetical protein